MARDGGVAKQVEKIAQRIKIQSFDIDSAPEQISKTSHSGLLSPDFQRNTICIWLAYFCLMFSFYYVASWTPKLLVDAGLTTTQGISAGIYLQAGGIIGALILGVLTAYFQVNLLTSIYLFLAVLSMTIFGLGGLVGGSSRPSPRLVLGAGLRVALVVEGSAESRHAPADLRE